MMTNLEQFLMSLDCCSKEDDEMMNFLGDYCAKTPKWSFDYGETRYAIWQEDWDFVLKIPRYGYASEDYCAIEVRNYQSAIQYQVDKLCLPIQLYYTTKSGIAVYKQQKYSFDCRTADDKGYNKRYLQKRNIPAHNSLIRRKVIAACYCGYRIDGDWMARVIQLYGKKFAKSFAEWTHANRVNDLHLGNTGYLNNKPIILDYAGYHD